MLAIDRKRKPFGDLSGDRGGTDVSVGSVEMYPQGRIVTHICRDDNGAKNNPDHDDPRSHADDRERSKPRRRYESDVESVCRNIRSSMYGRSEIAFRKPSLKFFIGKKKSVMELAAICGLPFRDGRVG